MCIFGTSSLFPVTHKSHSMKKQLRSELVSIAHRILKMDTEADYTTMQFEAKKLYDTLTILLFADKHFDGINPTIGKAQIIEALQEKGAEEVEEIIDKVEDKESSTTRDENVRRMDEIARANDLIFEKAREQRNQVSNSSAENHPATPERKPSQSSLYEPVIEKIKDMVAMMPPEADAIDDMFQRITSKEPIKNDRDDIGEYGRQAEFEEKKEDSEPVSRPAAPEPDKTKAQEQPQPEESRQKSLNDKFTLGLKVGLNDRIVFIKHLFNSNATDYNRVLSQLNTQQSKEEALTFIDQMVKPDYNNWEGKESYEARFKGLVAKKFDA